MRNLIGTPSINEMAGSSALGQTRRLDRSPATSGLAQITDIIRPARLVRLVPNCDIGRLRRTAWTTRLMAFARWLEPGCIGVFPAARTAFELACYPLATV
jgi:hypothetical protein